MNQSGDRANLKAWGSPNEGRVVVYISNDAYDAIYRHGKTNPEREVGGIFVGNVLKDSSGKYRVDIVGAIEAESAPGEQTQVQFTGAAWGQLVASAQRDYPNEKVVGWYHTHPGFGPFFSDDDVASHRIAFSNPWHIAAVCDPIGNDLCFFGWDESEIKAVKGFYTYEAPTRQAARLHQRAELPSSESRMRRFLVPAVALFLGLLGVLATVLVLTGSHDKPPFDDFPAAVASLSTEQTDDAMYVHSYYIRDNGEVWSQSHEWGRPASAWKQEDALPVALSQTKAKAYDNNGTGGALGTLEVTGQDEDGNPQVLTADIIETGHLVWQEPGRDEGPTAQPEPALRVTEEYLDFANVEEVKHFDIVVASDGSLHWEVHPEEPWLHADPIAGSESRTISVDLEASELAAGDYTGEIAVEWEGERTTPSSVRHSAGRTTVSVQVFVAEQPKVPEFVIVDDEIEDQGNDGEIAWRDETIRVRVKNIGEAAGTVKVSLHFEDTRTWQVVGSSYTERSLEPGEPPETFEFLVEPCVVGAEGPIRCIVTNLETEEADADCEEVFKAK